MNFDTGENIAKMTDIFTVFIQNFQTSRPDKTV